MKNRQLDITLEPILLKLQRHLPILCGRLQTLLRQQRVEKPPIVVDLPPQLRLIDARDAKQPASLRREAAPPTPSEWS